jgi:hypothetical protein
MFQPGSDLTDYELIQIAHILNYHSGPLGQTIKLVLHVNPTKEHFKIYIDTVEKFHYPTYTWSINTPTTHFTHLDPDQITYYKVTAYIPKKTCQFEINSIISNQIKPDGVTPSYLIKYRQHRLC